MRDDTPTPGATGAQGLVIERARVSFEGLPVSPERAQAITQRALRLVAEEHERSGLRGGHVGELRLPPLRISSHTLTDQALARALANALREALRRHEGGR